MFQIDWARHSPSELATDPVPAQASRVPTRSVRRTALSLWEEHCLECAAPTCYTNCSLYEPRADKACSRFAYGIYPNRHFKGLFDFGADIRFRRWGKLETRFYGSTVSIGHHRFLDRLNRSLVGAPGRGPAPAAPAAGELLRTEHKKLLAKLRRRYLMALNAGAGHREVDEWVLECYSPGLDVFRLTLECFGAELRARHSFEIRPGWNYYALPVAALNLKDAGVEDRLSVFPENDGEHRIIFTWLDFVEYRRRTAAHGAAATGRPGPSGTIKCVAWDLDNTLWNGILAEDGEAALRLRPEAREILSQLDDRGILQTVVSKNNTDDALRVIDRFGLKDYFLYPAVNWRPKSDNLREVASKLNIDVNTFALIDDSPFERAEVQAALPQVRVYSEDRIAHLLELEEFKVPVSASSKQRRTSYLTDMNREEVRQGFGGDYEAFLRSCNMRLSLFIPREDEHIARCLELIQRANQLNLSNVRYSEAEFRLLLLQPQLFCVAMACEDRFGKYGIVGFATVDLDADPPTVRDMVLSCRVARKRVEHAFICWLAARAKALGIGALAAEIVRTERNAPISQVFEDLEFRPTARRQVAAKQGAVRMERSLESEVIADNVVTVQAAPALLIDFDDAIHAARRIVSPA